MEELEALERRIAESESADRDDLEVRFRHTFEDAPIGMALITPEGKRFKVNQALADFLGYTVEELTNTDMGSTSGDDAALAVSMGLRQDVMDGKRRTYTNVRRYRTKAGDIVWGEVTGSLVRDEAGAPLYFVAQTIDITESKRAHEALRASEERFKDFAEVASDWFWEMDAELRYTFVSDAYERIVGKSPAALIGRTRREMYQGYIVEERDAWTRFLDALDAHQDIDEFTYTYIRPDGGRRVLRNSARAIFGDGGDFVGYRGMGVDVTQEVDALDALRAASRRRPVRGPHPFGGGQRDQPDDRQGGPGGRRLQRRGGQQRARGGPQGDPHAGRFRRHPDGPADAGDGRLRGDPQDSRDCGIRPAADHRPDGACLHRGEGQVRGRRHERPRLEACGRE